MSRKGNLPLPEDLEKELKDYYASPEPRQEFISRLELGLHSKLKEQEQRQMIARSKRTWVWAFGLVVVAVLIGLLATSPTVVAAMKRLFGYIPGMGVVEHERPLRVLAEPVSQTREGITITVNDAVLSSDKTLIHFTVENIPFDKLAHREDIPTCNGSAEVTLSDGSILPMTNGGGSGWGTGYEYRFTYAPFPADTNEATLKIPCIQDVLPGVLPEDWQFSLRFVPAPPGFTMMPVVEITPSQQASASPENPFLLKRVIETDNGYILVGEYTSVNLPPGMQAMGFSTFPTILDADGTEIPFNTPNDVDLNSNQPGVFPWAVQLDQKSYRWPLKLVFDSVDAEMPDLQTEFNFDAGPNPQAGQVWELNQDIQLGDSLVRLASIRFNGDGYTFSFRSDENVINAAVEIVGHPAAGASGGGAGKGEFAASLMYEGKPPAGSLKIRLYGPMLRIRGPWTLEWQPENASSTNLPAPMEAPQACLTLDSWQSALANPIPLPPNLTGKVIAYGRIVEDGQDPSPQNFGAFVLNLDGSQKQIIGPGVWPSLSPDGKRAAYAWEAGLYLADLNTGQLNLIPNTNANDYDPRWSPDGRRLAFVRIDDFNLYLINPDGSGLQRVTNEIDYEQLVSWTPDGTGLFYGVDTQKGISLRKLDLTSGAISELFTIDSKGISFSISPDGNRIAFLERTSDISYSLYVSQLDGSDRKLIGSMGHWMMTNPVWSPDGKWLMVGILDTENPAPETALALVNLEGCQIIPLSFSGDVSTWVP